MRRRKRVRNLTANSDRLADGELALAIEQTVERLTFEQFHRNKAGLVVLTYLIDRHDMIAFHLCHCASLTQKALACFLFSTIFRLDHFQGDRAFKLCILGAQDNSHTTLAQDLENSVVGKPPDLIRAKRRRQKG